MTEESPPRAPRFRPLRPTRRVRGVPRKRTIARKNITREVLARESIVLDDGLVFERPCRRGDCFDMNGLRPCPFVGCKHHLYLDVNPSTGSITLNFPHLEPWQMTRSCALDEADRGGLTLEEVGELTNLTRERIRQIELKALFQLKQQPSLMEAA